MILIRKSADRGYFDMGWLKTHHTFSFGDYYEPKFMGFSDLRVINEDFVAPGQGFPTHPHRDMEIITYLISGSLEHKDSMGNGSVINAGEIQRMSAGTGVTHSEFNHSNIASVHLFQIWIFPEKKGIAPGYEQKSISAEKVKNNLLMIASKNPDQNAVTIYQDAKLFAAQLEPGKSLSYAPARGRKVWIQMISGELNCAGNTLSASDALGVDDVESPLDFKARKASHFLLFDLR